MPERIAPIYRRLPPGPNRLSPGEVARHQRIRIHGAMIEAVSRNGYDGTSVRHVISLAGVSRRCFYEQFANKEECFLATFDVLAVRGVRRMRDAFAAARGDLEPRLRAAFEAFAAVAATRRRAASFVLVEAQTAGPRGALRLRHATAVCERLLTRAFSESPGAVALPGPLVRAMTGGLQARMSACIEDGGGPSPDGDVAQEMLAWTLALHSPAAERVCRRMAGRVAGRLRERPRSTRGQSYARSRSADGRERLLESALAVAGAGNYRRLTAAQMAESADVSMNDFLELFADKQECFLAALDLLGEEMLAIAAAPELTGSDWPLAVRRVMGELMCFLAEHPPYARTVAHEAFLADPEAARRSIALARGLAARLTAGAPPDSHRRVLVEGLAGAMWHTIRSEVARSRVQMLPALADHLSFVALAPAIGADAAQRALSEECGPL